MQRRAIVSALALTAFAGFALAQSPDMFTARLSWVPISLSEQSLVAGKGSATATLSRSRLTIEGDFEGLPAAATGARLHQGVATGARGPAIADLEVSPATFGTIGGVVDLNREQRAALVAGHLYIQLYAEPGVPPDNSILRGWLLAYPEAPSPAGRRER